LEEEEEEGRAGRGARRRARRGNDDAATRRCWYSMISQESEKRLKAEFQRSTVQMSGEELATGMSDFALNIPEENGGSSEHAILLCSNPGKSLHTYDTCPVRLGPNNNQDESQGCVQ